MEDVVTRPHQALLPGENEMPLPELWSPPLYFKPRNPASFCPVLYPCLWVRFCLNKVFPGVGERTLFHTLFQKPWETNTGFKHSGAPYHMALNKPVDSSWLTRTHLTAPSLTLLTNLLVKIKWGTLPTRGTTQPFIVCLMNFGLARWKKKLRNV